ncbi:hypothetical protein K4F52_006414 [Lecanicillium sp. MT-2017a]|nr:hypothetical protein K4F52_006414 [Lecanicillium sp. MT-2017a]
MCGHCSGCPFTEDAEQAIGNDAIRVSDLKALSLTCKALRGIAQPYVFHRVPDVASFDSLLRTLASRPKLARSIRCADMSFNRNSGEADTQLCKDVAPSLHMTKPTVESFWKREMHCSPGAELVLALLPNLDALRIRLHTADFVYPVFTFLQSRFDKLGAEAHLASLQTLTIRGEADSHLTSQRALTIRGDRTYGSCLVCNARSHVILSATPNLRHLTIQSFRMEPADAALWGHGVNMPRAASSRARGLQRLQSLSFDDCIFQWGEVTSSYLYGWVESCPALEQFRMVGSRELTERRFMPARHVVASLGPAQATLTHLHLDLSAVRKYVSEFPSGTLHGELLAQFVQLQCLTIDDGSFCDVEDRDDAHPTCLSTLIPRHIKKLVILYSGRKHVQRDLMHMAQSLKVGRTVSSLEQLEVWQRRWTTPYLGGVEQLRKELFLPWSEEVVQEFAGTTVAVTIGCSIEVDGRRNVMAESAGSRDWGQGKTIRRI